ncbi:MAG: hypothetical protein PHT07_24065 [Paludibacter sp.]|nr:hypothetical protein [Paludibacter sp.]
MKAYSNPKIYGDLESLYWLLMSKHIKISKTYRIVILEQQVYPRMLLLMDKTLKLHFSKKRLSKDDISEIADKIKIELELLKSNLTFLFKHKQISNGFYLETYRKVEVISKQISGWSNFLTS